MFLWNLFSHGTKNYTNNRGVIHNLLCLLSTPICKFITCNALNEYNAMTSKSLNLTSLSDSASETAQQR